MPVFAKSGEGNSTHGLLRSRYCDGLHWYERGEVMRAFEPGELSSISAPTNRRLRRLILFEKRKFYCRPHPESFSSACIQAECAEHTHIGGFEGKPNTECWGSYHVMP